MSGRIGQMFEEQFKRADRLEDDLRAERSRVRLLFDLIDGSTDKKLQELAEVLRVK